MFVLLALACIDPGNAFHTAESIPLVGHSPASAQSLCPLERPPKEQFSLFYRFSRRTLAGMGWLYWVKWHLPIWLE